MAMYRFSNLCGSVYRGGNVVFTPDGYSLLSAVGNRVTVFDLQHHRSVTMPFEARRNIARLALSNNGKLLLVIDVQGRSLVVNFRRGVVLHRLNFKSTVRAAAFSPCDNFLAVSNGSTTQVWRCPKRLHCPFVKHRTYTGHHTDVTSISWSSDSMHFITGSEDMTVRVYSRDPIEGFVPITLSGHRDVIRGCFFADGDGAGVARGDNVLGDNSDLQYKGRDQILYTVSRDGAVFTWKWLEVEAVQAQNEDGLVAVLDSFNENALKKTKVMKKSGGKGQWVLQERNFIQIDHCKIDSVELNRRNNLLVVGFSTGIFGLYDMPSCTQVHTLSISQHSISASAINATGEWIAFGSKKLGQLLVWEWQSETYVLKQQGHYSNVNALAYSPDGQLFVTGGDDGKVKLWNTSSGFCYVTFTEHTGPVQDLAFIGNGHSVVSASLDGTVRAFDLVRYRNFRIFTTPQPVQFVSCAVDPSGDIVVAGSMEPYEIYVFAMQSGRLLDILSGHTAPVSGLAFSPTSPMLASCSWDKTVRLWDVYKASTAPETLTQDSDVLAISWRPDGKELCAATLKGSIALWDPDTGKQKGSIDGRNDIAGGRLSSSRQSAMASAQGKCFTTVHYSADGQCIIAAGRSKWLCLYEASQKTLIKRWQLSHSRDMDGVLDKLNSNNLTEAGVELEDMDINASDEEDARNDAMPGAKRGTDASTRNTRLEVRSSCCRFSPTGRAIGVATTEGILIFSLDDASAFVPFELDLEVTPETIKKELRKANYAKALLMSLHLNIREEVIHVLEKTPAKDISLVAHALPPLYLPKLLPIVAELLTTSPHLEFLLNWVAALLRGHGQNLRDHRLRFSASSGVLPVFRSLQKALAKHMEEIGQVCDENLYSMGVVADAQPLRTVMFTNEDAKATQEILSGENGIKEKRKRDREEEEDAITVKFMKDENDNNGEWASVEKNDGMAGFAEWE